MQARKLPRRRQRHSLATRTKWWFKRRWAWYKALPRWKKILVVCGPLILFLVIIPILIYLFFYLTMGDMESLMNRNNTGVVLQDVNGKTFYSTGTAEHRDMVPLNKISDSTKKALLASEDKNFYEHGGVSALSTLRAVYGYIFSGGGEFGGSTLTQQVAKMTVLSSDRGLLRQYQTFSVAAAIEQRYSKDEILAMYLNAAYFGNNSFGIEQAAKSYFNKKPSQLTLAESALLIGLLPAPGYYSPVEGDPSLAKKRQEIVLDRMVKNGDITEAERNEADGVALHYQKPKEIDNAAPHYTEMVIAELYKKYGEEKVQRSGFQVRTGLDLTLQRQANAAVKERVPYIEAMGGSNAGLVAIDPHTFEIRALVGSVNYNNKKWGKVNMATTARQPGSSFKPIYYSAALADGVITPSTMIKDEPINIGGYSPHNATRQYYGNVTVRSALARSLNIPAVKVMQKFGVDRSIQAAKSMGITTLDKAASNGLSLAIGSGEVPLKEMAGAYAGFANQGQVSDTTTVHEIRDKFDKVTYTHRPTFKKGISEQGAFLISNILSDNAARAPMFGDALTVYNKNVAVKTGTTDDNRDAWTVGYSPDIAIGVWVGNNDNEVMVSGGSDMAGPIWRQLMTEATANKSSSFVMPTTGIVQRSVCTSDGKLANFEGAGTYKEYFLAGSLPSSGSCQAPAPEQKTESLPTKQPEEKPVEDDTTGTDDPPVDQNQDNNGNDNTTQPDNPTPTTPPGNNNGGGTGGTNNGGTNNGGGTRP